MDHHAPDLRFCQAILCAQRLSASTNGSLGVVGGKLGAVGGCSTPFGINEWITELALLPPSTRIACSTPFGINEWITIQWAGKLRFICVLNAFRHQRMDHLILTHKKLQKENVLNAFRHQRMDHFRDIGKLLNGFLCSTPFGINEWITRFQRVGDRLRFFVLNAFRHQRMDHLLCARLPLCICHVLNAFRHQRMDHPDAIPLSSSNNGAQRLSASTNGSLVLREVTTDGWQSAQRLSASTNGSQRRSCWPCRSHSVLNAFRHQRMDHWLIVSV